MHNAEQIQKIANYWRVKSARTPVLPFLWAAAFNMRQSNKQKTECKIKLVNCTLNCENYGDFFSTSWLFFIDIVPLGNIDLLHFNFWSSANPIKNRKCWFSSSCAVTIKTLLTNFINSGCINTCQPFFMHILRHRYYMYNHVA